MDLFQRGTFYAKFILYFILFGVIIAVATSTINYKLSYKNIEKQVKTDAQLVARTKQMQIENFMEDIRRKLRAVENNPLFQSYLDDPANKKAAQNLLYAMLAGNKNFFQVRYLDASGKEQIRAERLRFGRGMQLVKEQNLQNKSNRYYFQETKLLSSQLYYTSNLDLNVENGKIEKPIRPTLRIAKPIYSDERFRGIVIINVSMRHLLNLLAQSSIFNVYIVDKEGYFLLHPDKDAAWGRYLEGDTLLESLAGRKSAKLLDSQEYFSTTFSAVTLEHLFQNREGLQLILQTKQNYLQRMEQDNYKLALIIAALIVAISIPLGFLLAIRPAKTQQRLDELNKLNKRSLDIIDRYVLTSTTDPKGYIVDISSAYCRLSGYDRSELTGRKHSFFKSDKFSSEEYAQLWKTIGSGNVWRGEMQNRAKNGEYFWIDLTILPLRNAQDRIEGYTGIATDITDKKLIEKLSQEDKLTKTYNRTKLDLTLEREYEKYQSADKPLSVILVDIDHFKAVNDTYGHLVGDSVLVEVSTVLKDNVDRDDLVGRWGGEEFLIICKAAELSHAAQIARRLQERIAAKDFSSVGKVTASFGVAQLHPEDTADTLIKKADDALYRAKEAGRNRVETEDQSAR